MQLTQGPDSVREKHDSEAASGEIKAVVLEGQYLSVRLSRGKIIETALLRPSHCNLEKVGA
jgi:hypothetical protein